MTLKEVAKLLAYVTGACPQQKINELTPDAWHDILGHLDYDDARAAVRVVGARQPFISPSEIIAEVAARRSPEQPHSNACRGQDHKNCLMNWCMCVCHPRAVQELAGPPPYKPDATRQIEAGPRRFEPGGLRIGRSADE